MAPLRVSITKSEWLPDDLTAFVPLRLWKSPFITTWDGSQNQNHPTDSADQGFIRVYPHISKDHSERVSTTAPERKRLAGLDLIVFHHPTSNVISCRCVFSFGPMISV